MLAAFLYIFTFFFGPLFLFFFFFFFCKIQILCTYQTRTVLPRKMVCISIYLLLLDNLPLDFFLNFRFKFKFNVFCASSLIIAAVHLV